MFMFEAPGTVSTSSLDPPSKSHLSIFSPSVQYSISSVESNYTMTREDMTHCTTNHRYPIFSTKYSLMCKVYTGYNGTNEIEHGLCACTVDNPRDYLSVQAHKSCSIFHQYHVNRHDLLGLNIFISESNIHGNYNYSYIHNIIGLERKPNSLFGSSPKTRLT